MLHHPQEKKKKKKKKKNEYAATNAEETENSYVLIFRSEYRTIYLFVPLAKCLIIKFNKNWINK